VTGISQRNSSGKYYVNTRLDVAKTKTTEDFPDFDSSTEVYSLLTDLIEVNAKGFRGVVVTALVGLYLNDKYDPLNDFYSCNPRSIFEYGIWYALQENGIPCGKSDPLNVAKNANQLNEDWARGRRPQKAAMAVVKFLHLVIESSQAKRARLIDYFFFRLWEYAQSVTQYQLTDVFTSSASRQQIGLKLIDFTLRFPESGKLPQFLVAQLLEGVFRSSSIEVIGGGESVFGTNTTSKKPADIWLEIDGIETNLYEITVKNVSRKRLDDSLDALRLTGHLEKSVTFICRLPEDVGELVIENGSFLYKGKYFNFVDYRSFCITLFALLLEADVNLIFKKVADFVQDMHVSMTTKVGWNEFFSINTK
jgi:hypothetical protein